MRATCRGPSCPLVLALLLCAVLALSAATAEAQSLDNKGREFIVSFLRNYSTPNVELHLTSDVATSVTVEYPVNSPTFSTTVAVGPGAVTIVSLPGSAAQGWAFDAVGNNAVRAFSDDEFVCYLINRAGYTSDAALALPVDTMNTEYIVADYNPKSIGSMFAVTAAYDGTTVTITPAKALVGHAAGTPFSVTLDRGEAYYARSASTSDAPGTLTGTIVSADRPVGLSNGNGCTYVPSSSGACDHLFEVAQPVQSWGDRVFVANLPNRPYGSIYRILGSVDGTTVYRDGVFLGTVNRGAFIETLPLTDDHEFTATDPIYVVQYMTGQSASGTSLGDPAMANMIPAAQYLTSYTFSTVGGNQFAQDYVTIIAQTSDVGTLTLDGSPVPVASFTAIGTTGYAVARVQLTSGTHQTASPNPHGITVEGYNSYDSYLYPGGALFRFINPVGDENPPVCSCEIYQDPPSVVCTSTDDRPSEDVNGNDVLDEGEDLNGNGLIDEDTGIFFVELAPGATNLTLTVDAFVPGDGSVGWSVTLTDGTLDGSGTVVVTDGAGNTCEVAVVLIANRPPEIDCEDEVTVECASTSGTEVTLEATVTDPDGDDLTVTWTIEGSVVQTGSAEDGDTVSLTRTFSLGTHTVTATVDDGTADPVSCEITVNVVDTTGPVVTTGGMHEIWPPNHKYVAFDLSDCVESVVDACDGELDVMEVGRIVSISSDEPEDAKGNGDGKTKDDIVILDDTSFEVRAERQGDGNGRVYTVTFEVTDSSGNKTTATCRIGVPHDQSGDAPVDDGASAGYTVTN